MTPSTSLPGAEPFSDMGEPASDAGAQADRLYAEAMNHYQRRQWRQALATFTRLQELQPQRPGVAALIDEINWFIQLEEITPSQQPSATTGGGAPAGLRWLPWLISLFVLIVAVGIVIFVAGDRLLPFTTGGANQSLIQLYNEGQSQLAAGNYEAAVAAFERILETNPNDIGTRAGLEQAQLLRELAQRYARAQEAIAAENWAQALEELDGIDALFTGYRDVEQLRDSVLRQQEMDDLFAQATAAYNANRWADAIRLFEAMLARDPAYRAEAIQEFLFVSYLEEGERLINEQGESREAVRLAVQHFNDALTIHPGNQRAAEDRRLARLYESAARAVDRQDWDAVITSAEPVYAARPTYANNQITCLLSAAYVQLAQARIDQRLYQTALAFAQKALNLDPPCGDPEPARNIEGAVLLALATATPTSTATATPTRTPLPTATRTATPSVTPLPPSPTPPPPPPTDTPIPPPPTSTPTPAPPTNTPTPYR